MSPIPVLSKHWARKNKSDWSQRTSLNQISKVPVPIFGLTGVFFRVPGLLEHWGACHTHSSSSLFSNLDPNHHGDLVSHNPIMPLVLQGSYHSRISRSVLGLNGIFPYREYLRSGSLHSGLHCLSLLLTHSCRRPSQLNY